MSKFGIALRGLGLLGKKGKTISSVKPGKAVSHRLIKHLKESTTKVKGYDPKNPVHKEKMNKIRTDTGKDIREIEKKHGRVRYFGGGRTKLLEELGRVEAEPSNRNRRAEIARVHSELNKGYATGGRVGLKKGGKSDKNWIQKVNKSIKKRGTKGKCTPITKPGCTGRAKALAKTFKKMAAKRKKS